MDGLLEFSFEDIPQEHLSPMILNLICESKNISKATCDGADITIDSVINPTFWINLTSANEDAACHINLKTLVIEAKSVAHATLLITHYNNQNDMSVLLSTTDCRQAKIFASEEFYNWAKIISEKYEIQEFCGGLDSASDEDTQIYSKNGVGPITTI